MAAARNIIVGQRVDRTKAARAKELRREMTTAEWLLWEHLRRNQLHGLHFRRQQVIDGFIVDFYCHDKGLVVEVDGAIHRHQERYDAERDRVMCRRGLRVLRFANDEVMTNLGAVLEHIVAACRGQNLTP